MNQWKKVKFLDYIKLNPSIKLNKGELYPFVEMSNAPTNARTPDKIVYATYNGGGSKFEKNDTVIARIEPCLQNGKAFRCNVEKGFGSTEFLVFRPNNENIDSDYIYYFMHLEWIKDTMAASMVGATGRQRVQNSIFNSLEFTLPTLHTQHRIASILSRYDSLIENYQHQIKLLEEAAQRLYKQWFVDLKFPGYENAVFVDGIPQGWEWKKVGDLVKKVQRTKQVPTNLYQINGRIPVIDQSRVFIAGYTDDIECEVDATIPYIVFGDHTRILKYIPFNFAKGADGTQLIMSNDLQRMPQTLFFNSLINIDLSNYSYARHFKYLKEEVVIVPSHPIAKHYDKIVVLFYNNIKNLQSQIRHLTEARDRLLPKLMNGEIEV